MFEIFRVGEGRDATAEDMPISLSEEEVDQATVGQIAIDIFETERSIVIVAPIAGVDTDDINVNLSHNILTLSGNRERPAVYSDAAKILVEECFFGPFSRSVILPENLALNKIRATITNNLLTLEIPKLQFPTKTIKIDKLEG